jgi:hypothetical protein
MLVPFGGGVGQITKLGYQPVSLTAQFYGNAVHPVGTPAWTMRLQIAFLLPKLTEEQKKMMLEKSRWKSSRRRRSSRLPLAEGWTDFLVPPTVIFNNNNLLSSASVSNVPEVPEIPACPKSRLIAFLEEKKRVEF